MRKKDWAILLITALYSLLFYHQHAGLNFLLFTLAVVSATAALDRNLLKNKRWLFGALLTLLSGIFVFMHASSLAVLANFISLLLIASYGSNGQSSVLFSLVHGIYSIGGSIVFVMLGIINKSQNTERDGKTVFSKVMTILVPVLLSVIFLAIYKSANPLFANFTEKIDLSFISLEWLLFTFMGFFIAYGIINYRKIKGLDAWENSLPLFINNTGFKPAKWDERKAVILLFIILNLMLFFINMLDVNYLYLGAGMPMGITHKEFVHHGVGMLILSIVLAISTILYFFRGQLNFEDAGKTAKILVYVWIAQNLMMVVSTAFRNHLYITEALLTYKRIGVYSWLVMAAIGLVITCLKLSKQRSTWYLFKTNSVVAYVILVLSAGIDWDRLITDYNFSKIKHIASLDKKYLISLSETNLGSLYKIRNDAEFNIDSLYHYEYSQRYSNTSALDRKLYNYFEKITNDDWRSFSLRKQRVLNELKELNEKNIITSLDFSTTYLYTLKPVFSINKVTHLNLTGCRAKLAELGYLKKLETLNLDGNGLTSLDSLPEINSLLNLYLDNNSISTLKYLARTPNIEVLYLSNNHLVRMDDLPKLNSLKQLLLNGNSISNLGYLANYPKLESLSLNNYKTYVDTIAELPALKNLNLANSAIVLPHLKKLTLANLRSLNLSSNGLSNTSALVYTNKENGKIVVKFENLQELYLQGNNLFSVNDLNAYTQLKKLNLSDNKLRKADALATLENIEVLNLDGNQLQSVGFVENLQKLTELTLANNEMLRDFSLLGKLKNLTVLDVSRTSINDLSVLNAPHLEELNLKDCKLNSFKNTERFKKLKTLHVSNLSSDDVKELLKLKQLKTLYVSRTGYDWFQKLQNELRSTEVVMSY